MRFRLFPWLTVLICCFLCTASLPAEDEPEEEQRDVPALTEEQVAALTRITAVLGTETKVDVIETPLNDVCRDLSKEHKINIVLDPAGLKRAKINPDQLITINVKGTSLRTFLPVMLKPLKLTYLIRPDGLLITSLPAKEKAEQ